MYRRQLLILHTVLCIAAVLLAWRLVSGWKRANLRYGNSPHPRVGTSAYLPPSSPQQPAPPTNDIVAKNLFSPDRNNEMAKEEKPQPPPPVPIVFGTINLGGSYEALMAEKEQSSKPGFHRVKNGERMGGYTVVAISDEKVVIEFQGQKTTLDVYQSANSVPRAEPRKPTAAATPVVESAGTPPPQPAAAPPQPSSAPPGVPQDVRVTIEGNRRRMERPGPFGPSVWYEDIPPKQ